MGLREYWKKRDFSITPEPKGEEKPNEGPDLSFVIQKHAASHLHYDFRLELGGVLKSWSIPKGPSLDPTVKRLAMHTEDHPIDYGDFEGIIPKGQYGGGTVLLWDQGRWIPKENPTKGYHAGKLKFALEGGKLRGGFTLVKARGYGRDDDDRAWFLIKENDDEARPASEYSIVDARPESVTTGRSLDEIAAAQDRVWHSNRAEKGANGAQNAAKGRPSMILAARVTGAKKGPLPKKIRPAQPARAKEPPSGDAWLHEIQYDGERVIARVEGGRAQLLHEGAKDWTDRFQSVAAAIEALGVGSALIDGELAVLLPDGTTTPPPETDADAPEEGDLVLFAFDLLHLEGFDLTEAPLAARKEALERLLGPSRKKAGRLRYSGHIAGSGDDVFQNGCKLSLKGIVSKRSDAPYEPGRGKAWVRAACSAPKKAAPKKAVPKKAAPKRAASKKTAAKKTATARRPATSKRSRRPRAAAA
jgi:bifunctional non-homologous end joining protein LigD